MQGVQTITHGGLSLQLLANGGEFIGVGAIAVGDTEVHPGGGPPLRAVVTAAGGIVYSSSTLVDVRAENDSVSIETAITGSVSLFPFQRDAYGQNVPPPALAIGQETSAKLTWRFRPVTQSIADRTYRGFSLDFEYRSDTDLLHDIWLYSHWRIGSDMEGTRIVNQMWGSLTPGEWEFSVEEPFSTSENETRHGRGVRKWIDMMTRGAGTTAVDFQFKPGAGMLARWFDGGGMVNSKVEKSAGESALCFYDRLCCEGKKQHVTERMHVLLNEDASLTLLDGRNGWLRAFEETTRAIAVDYSLKPEHPEPILLIDTTGGWPGHRPGKQAPDFYTKWATRVDEIAAMGFKRVVLHTPGWVCDATENGLGNVCCHHNHVVAEEFGGNAALAMFCDAAHARGIEVAVWIEAHHSIWSDNFKKHPDWWVTDDLGNVRVLPEGLVNRIGDLNTGMRDNMLAELTAIRECGADGVWWDSFHNIGALSVSPKPDGTRSLQAVGAFALVRSLQAIGYSVMMETVSPLGCSAVGIKWSNDIACQHHVADFKDVEYTAYRTSFPLRGYEKLDEFDRDTFFRMIAHQAVLGLEYFDSMNYEWKWPLEVPSHVVELYGLWNRMAPHRGPITLAQHGVYWSSLEPGATVFWAIDDCPVPEGEWNGVSDVTEDTATEVRDGETLSAGRVYMLTA